MAIYKFCIIIVIIIIIIVYYYYTGGALEKSQLQCVCGYQQRSGDDLAHLLTFILVFMGTPQYMRNPHLRAGMAEALETLLPARSTPNQPTMALLATQSVVTLYS